MTNRISLIELEAQRASKFRDLAVLIAVDLGYGAYDSLNEAMKRRVQERTELIIERWEEAEVEDRPPSRGTRLEILLHDYHEICEQILDVQDEEARDFQDEEAQE